MGNRREIMSKKSLQFVVIKLEHAMSCDLLMMNERKNSDTFQERKN